MTEYVNVRLPKDVVGRRVAEIEERKAAPPLPLNIQEVLDGIEWVRDEREIDRACELALQEPDVTATREQASKATNHDAGSEATSSPNLSRSERIEEAAKEVVSAISNWSSGNSVKRTYDGERKQGLLKAQKNLAAELQQEQA